MSHADRTPVGRDARGAELYIGDRVRFVAYPHSPLGSIIKTGTDFGIIGIHWDRSGPPGETDLYWSSDDEVQKVSLLEEIAWAAR